MEAIAAHIVCQQLSGWSAVACLCWFGWQDRGTSARVAWRLASAHTGPCTMWAVLAGRPVQQAWARPVRPLSAESAGSVAACGKKERGGRDSRPGGRLAWPCCWAPWRPCWDRGAAVARLLVDGRSCAAAGTCRSAAAPWEGSRCGWHRCRWLYWRPCRRGLMPSRAGGAARARVCLFECRCFVRGRGAAGVALSP